MKLAVFEFRDFHCNFFCGSFRFFFNTVQLCPQPLICKNFFFQLPRGFGIFLQPFNHSGLGTVDNPRPHLGITELIFRLAFEHGRLHFDRHRRAGTFADILALVVFAVVFVNTFQQAFFKGGKMCATVRGVLSVDKRKIGFAVVVGVGKGKFELCFLKVSNRVERLFADFRIEQIE